jgi:hypothetical protein
LSPHTLTPIATLEGYAGHGVLPSAPWHGPDLLDVPTPTRVAFAGCWHARYDLVAPAMQAAAQAGAQVLVHTGDFLYAAPAAHILLAHVEDLAAHLGLFVVVVRGNHDDPAIFAKAVTSTRRRNKNHDGSLVVADPFARLSPHVLHAPNTARWAWQGVEFVALGGAYSVDRPARIEGHTYWSAEVASPRDMAAVKRAGAATVMLTHDIPAGADLPLPPTTPEWWDLAGAHAHQAALRGVVDVVQPDWVIGGHMHLRHSTSLFLPPLHAGSMPQHTRVEVLDKIESGLAGNLLVCDLDDAQMQPLNLPLG